MKRLVDYINESQTAQTDEIDLDAIAKEFEVEVSDLNKVISYVKHNNPSWQSFGEQTVLAAGCVEPEKKEGESEEGKTEDTQSYISKVTAAAKKLKVSGYFDEQKPKEKADEVDTKDDKDNKQD